MNWGNALIQGILLGGLYAIFATGLSLAFGVMRFVNLAHGDLAILAGYLTLSTATTAGVSHSVAIILVVVIMALIGFLGQRILFNRTIGPDPLSGILCSFGLGVVIQNVLLERYSATDRFLDAGKIETDSFQLNDSISVGIFPLLTFAFAVLLLGVLQIFLSRTRLGRAFRATADDPRTAQLMGINDKQIYGLAMAIAFATVGVAGYFLGARETFAPSSGPSQLLFGFEAVVIGGLGSLWGTLVGGIVLGVSQTLGNQLSVGLNLLVGHIVFLLVLTFRPKGLFGTGVRS
ncbi:MAG: branched-chain amino acid ABC transporter permease [Actinomycetota bacterium]|nr:branched-chain amino acid ABC transporter permease [Actinomycetota bacterium]